MRSLLSRPLGRLVESLGSGGNKRRVLAPCLVLCVAGGLASAGAAGGQEYSAYADPEKPVISFLLSEEKNVEDLRAEFGLDAGEVGRVLAVAREEKETLEGEYAESERIVAANESLPPEEIEEKIAASDYEEETEAAIADTKFEIEALLPEDRASDFGGWVDEQWAQEQEEFRAEARAGSSGGKVCNTIYASWYESNTENGNNYEVALPHKKIKFAGGYRVRVRHNGQSARIPVKEAGPWNTEDNYWAQRKHRSEWRDLPRCKPEAEAAYFDNYNKGEDELGREVANPAGIDLTLAAAERMGVKKKLRRNGIIKVDVRFPWVRR
jgi:hypothetical protein